MPAMSDETTVYDPLLLCDLPYGELQTGDVFRLPKRATLYIRTADGYCKLGARGIAVSPRPADQTAEVCAV